LLLEFTGYFHSAASLLTKQHLSLTKDGVCRGMCGRNAAKTPFFSSPCVLEYFISADILHAS